MTWETQAATSFQLHRCDTAAHEFYCISQRGTNLLRGLLCCAITHAILLRLLLRLLWEKQMIQLVYLCHSVPERGSCLCPSYVWQKAQVIPEYMCARLCYCGNMCHEKGVNFIDHQVLLRMCKQFWYHENTHTLIHVRHIRRPYRCLGIWGLLLIVWCCSSLRSLKNSHQISITVTLWRK